jgi:hypothetical protein
LAQEPLQLSQPAVSLPICVKLRHPRIQKDLLHSSRLSESRST